jgi:hypothetical protein
MVPKQGETTMAVQPYQLNGYQETVQTPFFRQNKVAVPGRVVAITAGGGRPQPTIVKNFLQDEFVGKSPNTKPVFDVYVEPSYNTAIG